MRRAIGICPGEVLALTGAGGKTTIALSLARDLSGPDAGRQRVVFTTTTKILPPAGMPVIQLTDFRDRWLPALHEALVAERAVCLAAGPWRDGKLDGVPPGLITELKASGVCDVIIVEADGAAGRSLKAPASHEPVIPPATDVVVPVAGADCLGAPLTEAVAHRLDQLQELGGRAGEPIGAELVAEALLACARGRPPGARVVPVINKVERLQRTHAAHAVARQLMHRGLGRVVLAAAQTGRPVRSVTGPVAALVLAAGLSRRFTGGPKLLYPIMGAPMLEHTLKAYVRAGLREVVVVIPPGAHAMQHILRRYPVRVVENPKHKSGMSTSLKVGLLAIFPRTAAGKRPADGAGPRRGSGRGPEPAAVIVGVGDQPYLSPLVAERLVQAFRGGAILAGPSHAGTRRPPTLFDRRLVPELMKVRGDQGGRAVVQAHQQDLILVDFSEGHFFRDIDTLEDL